jgi:hypothetical protein
VLLTGRSEIFLSGFWRGCQNNKWGAAFDFLYVSLHLLVSLYCFQACELLECITGEDWSHGICHEKTNSNNFVGARHRKFLVNGVLPRITRLKQINVQTVRIIW